MRIFIVFRSLIFIVSVKAKVFVAHCTDLEYIVLNDKPNATIDDGSCLLHECILELKLM